MAEVSPELQERLEELDRELEVSKDPRLFHKSPSPSQCLLLFWRLNTPLQLFRREFVVVACDQNLSS
jgi:hypothetical protein